MKLFLKNMAAVCFLAVFLPCTVTLLVNGRQGVHREERLSEADYEALQRLLEEDVSWMADGTLELLAVLYRTESLRTTEDSGRETTPPAGSGGERYDRAYTAVQNTAGIAVVIDGEYRELPYHAVSAGQTREGTLLGEEYGYLPAVECPSDVESESYLTVCTLSEEELLEVLGIGTEAAEATLRRDASDYVTEVTAGDRSWTGESFRALLHLPSSCFWMEQERDGVRFTVKGSGHGFGVSLYAADRLIREGRSLEDIFQTFYTGARCITIP